MALHVGAHSHPVILEFRCEQGHPQDLHNASRELIVFGQTSNDVLRL
jgi:hypothetical protein